MSHDHERRDADDALETDASNGGTAHSAAEKRRTGSNGSDTTDTRRFERSIGRRAVLAGTTAAAGSVVVGSATASDHGSDVPRPEIEGPIEGGSRTGGPQTAAVHDLDPYGYTEEEYFFSGTARSDDQFGDGFSWFSDEAEYTTRAIVYRPADPDDFNGHLLADWCNVSTGIDMPVTWINAYDYLMREGYAVAVISAQAVGVDTEPSFSLGGVMSEGAQNLVDWDPERYGDLNHPGDDYALDIFSQVVEGLRSGGTGADDGDDGGFGWFSGGSGGSTDGGDPLDGYDVEHVIATGQSQSAGYMASMINDVQPEYGQIDGYLPACSAFTDVPDDLVPVLWLNSEDETGGIDGFGGIDIGGDLDQGAQEDSGLFRLWEVAGASHVNYWLSSWNAAMVARDFGDGDAVWDETTAGNFGEQESGDYGNCQGNHFPFRHAYSAALEALATWIEDGTAPESAPRIERNADGEVVTDDHGNAVGGVRLPPIDAPVAAYDARSCDLEGQTDRFGDDDLSELYGGTDGYVDDFAPAVDDAVARGHLLPAAADELVERAEMVEIDGDLDDDDPGGDPDDGDSDRFGWF